MSGPQEQTAEPGEAPRDLFGEEARAAFRVAYAKVIVGDYDWYDEAAVNAGLDAMAPHVAALVTAAGREGEERGSAKERERLAGLIEQVETLVTAALETAVGWSGEPEGAPTVDAMELHSILYPAPPPLEGSS